MALFSVIGSLISVFFKNSPLGRWIAANALKIVAAIVVIIAVIAFAVHYKHLNEALAQSQQDLTVAQGTITQQKQQISNLQDAAKKAESSKKVDDGAVASIPTVVHDVVIKYVAAKAKVDTSVAAVQADTTLTADEKAVKTSQIYIDDLWTGYCAQADANQASCVKPPVADPAPAVSSIDVKELLASLPTITVQVIPVAEAANDPLIPDHAPAPAQTVASL